MIEIVWIWWNLWCKFLVFPFKFWITYQTYFFFRLSYLDQSILLNSNMKKYLQYAKAYVISQNFEYDEAYFNSIDVEAQFIGL